MSQSYVYPGANDTYVPSLSSELVVDFSRNPNAFPAVEYIDYNIVDKMRGYYLKYLCDDSTRIINDSDNVWADGADRPETIAGNASFTMPTYECIRRTLPRRIGHLAIDQAGWDVVDLEARHLAAQLMTQRVRRIHEVLTTSANWSWGLNNANSNYATATTAGGGLWANATGTNPYIRKSLAYAQIAIEQATNGVVKAGDLFLVMNPDTAKIVATSQEFYVFLQQQPRAIEIWENSAQFRLYGLPDMLMGLRVIVDNTVYNTANPGVAASNGFTFPDNYACLLSKPKALSSAAGRSFSTYSAFLYEDMKSEVFDDPRNRLVRLNVTENIDTSANALVAPQSGYLIATGS